MKLRWSAHALMDRGAIFDHVVQDSPRAAVALDERIEARVERLSEFPHSGRPGRILGTRELVLAGTPYIVAYTIDGDIVRILRVLHASRPWPDDLPLSQTAQ